MPSEVIIIVIDLILLGVGMFLALHELILFILLIKMSLSPAKNIFMPVSINSINIIYISPGLTVEHC